MPTLEERIIAIENRNKRVEADKAWELSWTRRVLLLLFTYAAIGVYLQVIGAPDPWLNALGASLAFLLSTLTLSFIKELWLKNHSR